MYMNNKNIDIDYQVFNNNYHLQVFNLKRIIICIYVIYETIVSF